MRHPPYPTTARHERIGGPCQPAAVAASFMMAGRRPRMEPRELRTGANPRGDLRHTPAVNRPCDGRTPSPVGSSATARRAGPAQRRTSDVPAAQDLHGPSRLPAAWADGCDHPASPRPRAPPVISRSGIRGGLPVLDVRRRRDDEQRAALARRDAFPPTTARSATATTTGLDHRPPGEAGGVTAAAVRIAPPSPVASGLRTESNEEQR